MPRYIEKIVIEKLFGHYNYVIEKLHSELSENPLLIIYGDNGSGKTTLLELLFNLISTVDNAGHKSKIAKTKFKSISVYLHGDTEIIATRRGTDLIGSFDFAIRENGVMIHHVYLQADNDLSIRIADSALQDIKEFATILNYIKALNISVHYLSDTRKLQSTTENHSMREAIPRKHTNRFEYEMLKREGLAAEESNDLEVSVKKLENWIRQHVLQGSKAGDKNTNTIYTDIIKRVSIPTKSKVTEDDVNKLLEKLTEIRKESLYYFKNGLVSKIDTKEIEATLSQSNQGNFTLIYNVLEPYVEGLRSRLDSLSEIQETINLFTNNINDYFSLKSIKYHLVTRAFSRVN